MKKLVVGGILSCLCGASFAGTWYWTGAAGDGDFATPGNWADASGKAASSKDAVCWYGFYSNHIFTNDVPLTISTCSHSQLGINDFKVLGTADVTIGFTMTKYNGAGFEIAEGVTLHHKGYLAIGNAGSYTTDIAVSGGGTLELSGGRIGYGAAGWSRIATFDVKEGALVRNKPSTTVDDYFNVDKVVVRGGAEFRVNGSSLVPGANKAYTELFLEEGAVAQIGNESAFWMDGIEGAGDVEILSPHSTCYIRLALKKHDYLFSGRYRGTGLELSGSRDYRMIVGKQDSLRFSGNYGLILAGGALGFAAGLGSADFNWVLANSGGQVFGGDENGDSVALRISTLDYSGNTVISNVTLSGYANATWMNKYAIAQTRPRAEGVRFSSQATAAHLAVSNACLRAGNSVAFNYLGSMDLTDATLELLQEVKVQSASASYALVMDRATVRVNPVANPYTWYFPAQNSGTPFGDWTVRIGPRGARWELMQECGYGESSCHSVYLNAAFATADGIAADGGLVLSMPNVLYLSRPFALKGPVTLTNGRVNPLVSAYDGEKPLFGTGSLCLDNAWLVLRADTRLASGAGGALRAEGSARMSFRSSSTGTPAVVTAGDEDATASSLSFGQGGVLFLSDDFGATAFDGSCGKLFVKGGVPVGGGRVTVPVFSALKNVAEYTLGFLTYGEANGFTDFTGYATDLDQGAGSVVKADANVGTLEVPAGETRTIAGLQAIAYSGANWNSNRAAVKINANATLKVGDGNGPAVVLMSNRGTYGHAEISGSGVLDFGTSDAVIACAASAGVTVGGYPPEIATAIAGDGALTFAAPFALRYAELVLSGNNTYSGGTYVSDVQLRLRSDAALGSGSVKVLGGSACGGQLCFDKKGMTFANPLEVSGLGIHQIASYTSEQEEGALWFRQDATVAGSVTVNGTVRFGSYTNSTVTGASAGTGTFKGAISGGAIQLLRNVKPVVFAGANTYTGGTEIVRSTLTLRGSCSAGTGPVALDRGVLRFENESSVAFANGLEGIGTVELAGSAPVTFAADAESCANLTLDLCGTAQAFAALPPFANIANSSAKVASIALAGDLGTLEWNGRTLTPADKIDLSVGAGTTLDLGGATLTVRRLGDGSRERIVNGEVVELKPKQGILLIVR